MLFSCAAKAFVFFGVSGWANSAASPKPTKRENDRPNVVVILTDDQDVHLNSMDYLPLVKQHMTDKGTSFKRHYCTVALCCPSRVVTLWNTNVTSIKMPYGNLIIEPAILADDWQAAIPNSLRKAWTTTISLYGCKKRVIRHIVPENYSILDNYDEPFARGFTGNDFLLDLTTYQYLNATIQTNHDAPVSYAGQYSTDVIAQKTLAYIDDAMTTGEPFFIVSSPIAPQADQTEDIFFGRGSSACGQTQGSIPRYQSAADSKLQPRIWGDWVRLLPQQNDSNVEYNDEWYRSRLRALQSVDELAEGVVNKLASKELLNDTYIIYTSDNGYHIGQHRLQPGKMCGYEEDANVPMIIRGPGIKQGAITNLVTSHTDLAPTILSLIGTSQRPDFDGTPFSVKAEDLFVENKDWQEHVGVEYWGPSVNEGIFDRVPKLRNTYKALRVIGSDYSFYYAVWCHNEHELYDMTIDPNQLTNLFTLNGTTLPMSSSGTLLVG
ncbi:arylsulfatase [Venturia nashicola]|uniref:Arylsulfatase n=1 Tax=Venturia nashicola TaxID=86259 RepID=A0A4Z1P9F3_9PEZI|nr:arylsulfatase [Venturia nashicola]